MELTNSYTDQIAPVGSAIYYSFLFVPPTLRFPALCLYALGEEFLKINLYPLEKNVALAKLAWWRLEVQRFFEDQPEHPLFQALQQTSNVSRLHPQRFLNILNAVERELLRSHALTEKERLDYALYTQGELEGLVVTVLAEKTSAAAFEYARSLGIGRFLLRAILLLRTNFDFAWSFLGKEEIEITFPVVFTPALQKLIAERIQLVEHFFEKANQSLPLLERGYQYSGLSFIKIQQELIKKIKKAEYNVLKRNISLTPLKMLWIVTKNYYAF